MTITILKNMSKILDEGKMLYPQDPYDPCPQLESVFRFVELPFELRMKVYRYMSLPTLFRALHVNRMMRSEAKNYFWNYSKVWYQFRINSYKTQLPRIANGVQEGGPLLLPAACLLASRSIAQLFCHCSIFDRKFWQIINTYFPSVVRIIHFCYLGNVEASDWNILRAGAGLRHITVLICCRLNKSYRWMDYHNRRIVKLNTSMCSSMDLQDVVVVPVPYLGGHVGDFIGYQMTKHPQAFQRQGADVLQTEAALRYKFKWETSVIRQDRAARQRYKESFIRQLQEEPTTPANLHPESIPIYRQLQNDLDKLTLSHNYHKKKEGKAMFGVYLW